MGDIFGPEDPAVKDETFKQWDEPSPGRSRGNPVTRLEEEVTKQETVDQAEPVSPPKHHRWCPGSRTCDNCGLDYDWSEESCGAPLPPGDARRVPLPSPRLYADRKPWELEPHYSAHVAAMTAERLHDKAAIAAELAFRDAKIEQLKHQMSRMVFDDRELGWD